MLSGLAAGIEDDLFVCRVFRSGNSPSAIGGFTITDAEGILISRRVIRKAGLANNEAEGRGIMVAVDLAEAGDIIVSDSQIALGWVRRGRSKARADLNDRLRPSFLATRPLWKPCCRTAGLPPILSTGWSSGKKNPTKPRFVAARDAPLVGSAVAA